MRASVWLIYAPALLALVGLAAACTRAPRESPVFQRAQADLERVLSETLDPSYGDPKFEPVKTQFEAVPKDAVEYEAARDIIALIDKGQRERAQRTRDLAARRAEEKRIADEALQDVRTSLQNSVPTPADIYTGDESFGGEQGGGTYNRITNTNVAGAQTAARLDEAIRRPRAPPEPPPPAEPVGPTKAEREACAKTRAACLERCAWVVDTNFEKGQGLGSPTTMRCAQSCMRCE